MLGGKNNMAYTPLSTDFKDQILSDVNAQRKYKQTVNEDGTVSLRDVTAYDQEGSSYSSKDIIEEREAINNIYANKVVSLDEASLVTEPGFFCDALVINEINKNLTDKINTVKNINKNITKMIGGSKVVTAKAGTSVQVFTNSEINKSLGVTNSSNANTVVLMTNGDGLAQKVHVEGSTYLNSAWHATFNQNASAGSIRINYVIFYFG
jgi:hypothetical protein